jgi:hypothetical protein
LKGKIVDNKIIFELINIDRENKSYNRIDIKSVSVDLREYVLRLRETILDEKERRVFDFTSNTTEVIVCLKKILANDKNIKKQSEIIAKRLLVIENEIQSRYEQIVELKKGSLIICKFLIDEIYNILLVKIEHTPFIDETDLKRHIGLPFKNEILKSCLFQFDDSDEIINITAHDSNGTIANYWWNRFLELKEVTSDEKNTIVAFNGIDSVLNKDLKKLAPSDYTLLRNNLIGYFHTTPKFSIKKLLDYVIGDYEPINPGVNIAEIKDKIMELPKKIHFDTSFKIIPGKIKARSRNIIRINDRIELRIQNYVDDLRSVIYSEMGDDGKKYIKIAAEDSAFDRFKYNG